MLNIILAIAVVGIRNSVDRRPVQGKHSNRTKTERGERLGGSRRPQASQCAGKGSNARFDLAIAELLRGEWKTWRPLIGTRTNSQTKIEIT